MKTDHTEDRPATAQEENDAMLLQGELADGLRSCTGLKESIANEWARQLVDYLRERLGSQRVYIPKPPKAARDASIAREYDGTNAAEVMQRYGLRSRSRLYEIVEEQRALVRRRLEKSDSPVFCLKSGQSGA